MVEIAFLGLGEMGRRMVARLLDAGHTLRVWNRSPAKALALEKAGARWADTPRLAAAGADLVISMVRDDQASAAIWMDPVSGALPALADHAVAIECSTLSIDWVKTLARRFADHRRAFIEAPVAGSLPQAEQGKLVFFASGGDKDVERVLPVLRAMGGTVHQAGSAAGDGALVKLVVNALLGIEVCAMAELLALTRRQGADPVRLLEMVATTAVSSPALQAAAGSMIAGNFTPMFPVELMEKDLAYALVAAGDGARLPLVQVAKARFEATKNQGFGRDHITRVAALEGGDGA